MRRRRPRNHRLPLPLLLFLTTLGLGAGSRALAHGEPASLDEWGGFGRLIAACQRAIGSAGFLCGIGTWEARRDCYDARLRGEDCDETAADARAEQARLQGTRKVIASCSFQQLQNLRFLDLAEAQLDVIRFCAQLEVALFSAVYGGETAPVDTEELKCRLSAARAANKMLHFAIHERLDAMNRIAASPLGLVEKQALVHHSTVELARARAEVGERLAKHCSESTFRELYSRTPDAFLDGIATRADCLIDATYAQAEIVCPPPICGNGMQEPGEQCDDANEVETDSCTSSCRSVAD